VYCKRSHRGLDYPRVCFTFLGYTFRPRGSKGRDGTVDMNFLPAVSATAVKRMKQTMREWQVSTQTSVSLNELARRYNATLRGWLNYYGLFYKTAMRAVYRHLDNLLVLWARRKYRTLAKHPRRARRWLDRMVRQQPRLFVHWSHFRRVTVRTMGAV